MPVRHEDGGRMGAPGFRARMGAVTELLIAHRDEQRQFGGQPKRYRRQMLAAVNRQELARLMVGREVVLRVDRPPVQQGPPRLKIQDLWVTGDKGIPALRGDRAVQEQRVLRRRRSKCRNE